MNDKKGKQQEEQFVNVCINTRSKDGTDAMRLTSEDTGEGENCIWLQSCLLMDYSC